MIKFFALTAATFFAGAYVSRPVEATQSFEEDVFATSAGELKITFFGHGSLMFTINGKALHIDPYSAVADYSVLPKADAVFITHEHQDHLDKAAIEHIATAETEIILNGKGAMLLGKGRVVKNGEFLEVLGIKVDVVPACNVVHKRENGEPFHPKEEHNGYVFTFGDMRVYVAGDTENIPEMKELKNIRVAFLPMNLPYTMTPEMVAGAALSFRPEVLYPYHFGETDTGKLTALLRNSGIDVRIRRMK